jgi:hypothetical protein
MATVVKNIQFKVAQYSRNGRADSHLASPILGNSLARGIYPLLQQRLVEKCLSGNVFGIRKLPSW